MADRSAKRPKLTDPVTPPAFTFDMLPPDVITSEILIHITVGVDIYTSEDDQVGPKAKVTGCFGRFCRDPLRYPWPIFRRININPVTRFLELTPRNVLTEIKNMILPLRYAVQLTVPVRTTQWMRVGPSMVRGEIYTELALERRGKTIDFMKLEWAPDKKLLSSFEMPLLTTISSLLLGGGRRIMLPGGTRDKMYPNATTILMQGPMNEIPMWCVTLRVQEMLSITSIDAPGEIVFGPSWVNLRSKPLDQFGVIGRHSRPRLENIIFKQVDPETPTNRTVVWNMKNVPSLRRFVIEGGTWDPQFLLGRGSYYDFLSPLNMLDELELNLQIPANYKKHWFLPRVRSKLKVSGFTVPPGYKFPPNSGFTECRFDPQHTYLLPPGGVKGLLIHQEQKYDAPNTVYTDAPWKWDADELSDLPGRITIAGNVNVLSYTAIFYLKPADPDADAVPPAERQALVELNGLPYEFVFNGNIGYAEITSGNMRRSAYPDTNLVQLNGLTKKLRLYACRFLEVVANRLYFLQVFNSKTLTITITERVSMVYVMNTDDCTINAPLINLLTLMNSEHFVNRVTVGSTVRRVDLIGQSFNVDLNRVAVLNISCKKVTIRIAKLGVVQMIVFDGIESENVTFKWPANTPNVRIPNHKLTFMNMTPLEVDKLRRKLTGY